MIIGVIDVKNILAFKAQSHTPIRADSHGPVPLQLTFERMQFESRQVHVRDRAGRIKSNQDVSELHAVFGQYAARVIVIKKAIEPLVAEALDHLRIVMRYVTDVK
jgi:hypothetical protein